MASLNRIVLIDSAGGELFSGNSLLSEPGTTDDEEPCPETLRSSVFVRIDDDMNALDADADIEVTFAEDDEHAA